MTAASKQDLPHFVAIQRIMKLPVVSSGVHQATCIYVKVKSSNKLIEFSLDKTEKTVLSVVDLSTPLVIKFEDPINRIDNLMCKSLDIVEHNLPIVTYTPSEIYFTTKTYIKAKVEPVLKRADSVSHLALLDNALSMADEYVDKYLPDKDAGEDVADKPSAETDSQTVKTIRHVNHFSRKLQRRLTRRTIAEAKLLKKQGFDTVQCFVYFADLLAKDPKAFAEKMKAIWKHLSEDEPENQKPPANIEQLIEMLTREGARRFVHVTNFIVKNVYMTPSHVQYAFTYIVHETVALTAKINKYIRLETAKDTVMEITNRQVANYNRFVAGLRTLILHYLSSLIDEPKETADAGKSSASKTNNNGKSQKTDEKKNDANATQANSSTTNAKRN